MKRLLLLFAVATSVLLAGCATVGPATDAEVTNGLGRSDASYDANVVSNILPSDAVVFYKSDLDSSYKKSAATETTVSVSHLENIVSVEAKKFSLVTVQMLVSDPSTNARLPSLVFLHKDANEAVSKDLNYYITFNNSGTVPVKNILFVDNLPGELTPRSVESLSSVNIWGGAYDRGGIYVPLAADKVKWDVKEEAGKRVLVVEINDPAGLPINKSFEIRLRAHFDWPARVSQAAQPQALTGGPGTILVGTVRLDASNWGSKIDGAHTDLELTFNDLATGQVLTVNSSGQDGLFSFAPVVGHKYQLTKIYYSHFSAYIYAAKAASWVVTDDIKDGVNVLGRLHYQSDKQAKPQHIVTLDRNVEAVKQSFLAANPNSTWDSADWNSVVGP